MVTESKRKKPNEVSEKDITKRKKKTTINLTRKGFAS
jgi:hypothetical protein